MTGGTSGAITMRGCDDIRLGTVSQGDVGMLTLVEQARLEC